LARWLLRKSSRTALGAVSDGVQEVMAKRAKQAKKPKKLRVGKKLDKTVTLKKVDVLTARLPYV